MGNGELKLIMVVSARDQDWKIMLVGHHRSGCPSLVLSLVSKKKACCWDECNFWIQGVEAFLVRTFSLDF